MRLEYIYIDAEISVRPNRTPEKTEATRRSAAKIFLLIRFLLRKETYVCPAYPASIAHSGAAATVSSPVTTMARELAAPWISPSSTAREVPAAWEEVPMARPWARGSVTRNSFRKAGAATAPKSPVTIIVAIVMVG